MMTRSSRNISERSVENKIANERKRTFDSLELFFSLSHLCVSPLICVFLYVRTCADHHTRILYMSPTAVVVLVLVVLS